VYKLNLTNTIKDFKVTVPTNLGKSITIADNKVTTVVVKSNTPIEDIIIKNLYFNINKK
jgi:hypothetical protein